ncbi:hypothetical protein LI90_2830 [Carbonactinospora thermoautotrophica]|uniref:Uncharacterized protein n=1 Tax=Carbonactinospora thermoautotrophica TaxID=1469144 RepID=A0A132MV60_9ACTN|nr:hypothetical protein LI90_2830 [Carbonactinospora thermoautotrophica]
MLHRVASSPSDLPQGPYPPMRGGTAARRASSGRRLPVRQPAPRKTAGIRKGRAGVGSRTSSDGAEEQARCWPAAAGSTCPRARTA